MVGNSADFFLHQPFYEVNDWAANSLSIHRAKHFAEAYGNYSRWGRTPTRVDGGDSLADAPCSSPGRKLLALRPAFSLLDFPNATRPYALDPTAPAKDLRYLAMAFGRMHFRPAAVPGDGQKPLAAARP